MSFRRCSTGVHHDFYKELDNFKRQYSRYASKTVEPVYSKLREIVEKAVGEL